MCGTPTLALVATRTSRGESLTYFKSTSLSFFILELFNCFRDRARNPVKQSLLPEPS